MIATLTNQERLIIESLSDGLTVAQIAQEMSYTPAAIYSHLNTARRSLGADSLYQAVAIYARHQARETTPELEGAA